MKLNESAPIRLVASKTTKTEQKAYRRSGESFFSQGATVNVKNKIYKAVLTIDGQPAWTFQTTQTPGFRIDMQQGESIADAVNRSTKANANYFRGISLPRHLVHPTHAGPLGETKITGLGR